MANAKYRLTPLKERMVGYLETVGASQVVFEGGFDEATKVAVELLYSNKDFLQVDITKIGKTVMASKKVGKVTSQGVFKYGLGGTLIFLGLGVAGVMAYNSSKNQAPEDEYKVRLYKKGTLQDTIIFSESYVDKATQDFKKLGYVVRVAKIKTMAEGGNIAVENAQIGKTYWKKNHKNKWTEYVFRGKDDSGKFLLETTETLYGIPKESGYFLGKTFLYLNEPKHIKNSVYHLANGGGVESSERKNKEGVVSRKVLSLLKLLGKYYKNRDSENFSIISEKIHNISDNEGMNKLEYEVWDNLRSKMNEYELEQYTKKSVKLVEGGVSERTETQENNFGISYKLGDKFTLGRRFGNYGKSAFTFEGLDKRFQKLDWRDTTEAYYGLDFTPFMSEIENYATSKYAKGGNSNKIKKNKIKMEIKKVLSEYKNHVDKYYKNGISYWKNDKKMTEMLKKDKSDHLYVIEQMINENWVYAYKYWIGMDTASREQITNDAYDLLNEKNGHNKYAKGSTIKGGKFKLGDKVKVVRGANKGEKGVVSNTDSDFFGEYTINVRGHKLGGFKADDLVKFAKGSTIKGGKFKLGDKVKVVRGANKGEKGVVSNTDSDFFGEYTINVRGHKLGGFKADDLVKFAKGSTVKGGGEYRSYVNNIYRNQSEQSARDGLMRFASEQGFEISDVENALQVYKYDTEENAWGENYYTKVAIAKMVDMISGKYAKGSTIKGKSAFTFEGLDKRFQKLDWRDTTEAYYGLDFTPFMSVVEEYIEHGGKSSQGLDSHFEQLGWRDTTEAYYGLDFTPFMSEIENYATSKYAKGGSVNGFNYTIGGL